MGYESKVYVCDKGLCAGDDNISFYETIAAVNMCKMGWDNGWRDLFKTPVGENMHFYGMDFEDNVTEDCYGASLKECPLEKVVNWLEEEMKKDNYRRLGVLYNLLKGFEKEQWGELVVVHYGY